MNEVKIRYNNKQNGEYTVNINRGMITDNSGNTAIIKIVNETANVNGGMLTGNFGNTCII